MNKEYSHSMPTWLRFCSFILSVLVVFLAFPTYAVSAKPVDKRCVILGAPNTACDKIGTIFNNGKGNKRKKGSGGNSFRIRLVNLRKYYLNNDRMKEHVENWCEGFLSIHKTSGTIKYIAIHVRSNRGKWHTVYKGKKQRFQLKTFKKYWKNSRYTDMIISVNGEHDRFEAIKAKADLYICISARRSVLAGLPPCYGRESRFLEKFTVSAKGQKKRTKTVTRKGITYTLVVSGTFQYDQGETGTRADAQHEQNDVPRFIRNNFLAINGSAPNATKSNLSSHVYEFHITGTGRPLTLHIKDSNYSDNAGFLTVKLYGP